MHWTYVIINSNNKYVFGMRSNSQKVLKICQIIIFSETEYYIYTLNKLYAYLHKKWLNIFNIFHRYY